MPTFKPLLLKLMLLEIQWRISVFPVKNPMFLASSSFLHQPEAEIPAFRISFSALAILGIVSLLVNIKGI